MLVILRALASRRTLPSTLPMCPRSSSTAKRGRALIMHLVSHFLLFEVTYQVHEFHSYLKAGKKVIYISIIGLQMQSWAIVLKSSAKSSA